MAHMYAHLLLLDVMHNPLLLGVEISNDFECRTYLIRALNIFGRG